MRALVLLLLLAVPAPAEDLGKPFMKSDGIELWKTGPDGYGAVRWYIRYGPAKAMPKPFLLFDDTNYQGDPPQSPVTLRRKYDESWIPAPKKGEIAQYRLFMAADGKNTAGKRGVLYVWGVTTKVAYPLMWWGFAKDPGFERATPAQNAAKIKKLFPELN